MSFMDFIRRMKARFQKKTPSPKKSFTKVVFPHVRQVAPQMLAQQIVSVQPMSLPSGMLFWLDFGLRRPVKNQEELNRLFKIWEILSEKYPVGSIVNLNFAQRDADNGLIHYTVDSNESKVRAVEITSEFYVLSEKNSVGFLCSESTHETDFCYADYIEGYEDLIKGIQDVKQ